MVPRGLLTPGGSAVRDTAGLPAGLSWGCWGPVCVCQQGTREAGRLGEVWIGGERGKREPKEIPEVGDLSGHVWPELLRFLPVREPVRRRGHRRPLMSSGCVAALRR